MTRFAACALLACGLVACERPDHIEIDPRVPRLTRKGELLRLHGKLMDRGGRIFSTERAVWSSRDPLVAYVDENGAVVALGSGHTVLTARWNELSATVPVDVDLVEALDVRASSVQVKAAGAGVRLAVTPVGLDGRPLRDREVHLVSLRPAVARVDDGKVWGLARGEALVRAKLDDKEADIRVVVK